VARALQKARKRRRVTLEEAAAETRLPRRALAAFEESGDDADLPEPPYDRYFLREYARYLGLDDETLLNALAPQHQDELEIPFDLLPAERRPRRWPAWLLATASAAALIILAAVRMTSSDSPALLAGGAVLEPTPAPRSEQPAQPSSPTEAAPTFRGVSAVLRLTGPCWIQATEDGQVVMSETAPAGTTLRFHAKRTLVLRLGNGGGARLTVNGRRVPTGATGEVVQLSFAWSNGRLTQT
jgi:cytoskeletal protein RodZ